MFVEYPCRRTTRLGHLMIQRTNHFTVWKWHSFFYRRFVPAINWHWAVVLFRHSRNAVVYFILDIRYASLQLSPFVVFFFPSYSNHTCEGQSRGSESPTWRWQSGCDHLRVDGLLLVLWVYAEHSHLCQRQMAGEGSQNVCSCVRVQKFSLSFGVGVPKKNLCVSNALLARIIPVLPGRLSG